MAEVWVAKTIALISLFLLPLFTGLLSLKLVHFLFHTHALSWPLRLVSGLNSAAGGVFIATIFLHLLPEVREGMSDIWEKKGLGDELPFPFAECLVVLGLFAVLFLEHLILTCAAKPEDNINQHYTHDQIDYNDYGSTSNSESQPLLFESRVIKPGQYVDPAYQKQCSSCDDAKTKEIQGASNQSGNYGNELLSNQSNTGYHGNESHSKEERAKHELRALVLLLALSTHTIFEGLALGLLQTQAEIWTLFIAIAIHKVVIAFSLGMRVAVDIKSKVKRVVFVVLFSLMCPLGGVIGTVVTETAGDSLSTQIASTVLQGIATGTFLHVTFFEILQEEIGVKHNLINVTNAFLGFVFMGALVYFFPS